MCITAAIPVENPYCSCKRAYSCNLPMDNTYCSCRLTRACSVVRSSRGSAGCATQPRHSVGVTISNSIALTHPGRPCAKTTPKPRHTAAAAGNLLLLLLSHFLSRPSWLVCSSARLLVRSSAQQHLKGKAAFLTLKQRLSWLYH